MEAAVKKTWKPIIAGILDIVAGGLSLGVLFIFAIGPMIVMPLQVGTIHFDLSLLLMVVPGLTIEALAIVGGVFAIQRRRWGWAVTGSIAASIIPAPLGIVAIIFTFLAKKEFN